MEKNHAEESSKRCLEAFLLKKIDEYAFVCLSMFQAMEAFEITREKLIDDYLIKQELQRANILFRTGNKLKNDELEFFDYYGPIHDPCMKSVVLHCYEFIEQRIKEEFKFVLANEYNYHFFGGSDLGGFLEGCGEGNSFFGLPNFTKKAVDKDSHFLDDNERELIEFYKYQLTINDGGLIDAIFKNMASEYISKREGNFEKLINEYIYNYNRVIYSMMKVEDQRGSIMKLHWIGILRENEILKSEGVDELYQFGTNSRHYYYQDPFNSSTDITEEEFMFSFKKIMKTVFNKQITACESFINEKNRIKYEYLIRLCDFRSIHSYLPENELDPYYSS